MKKNVLTFLIFILILSTSHAQSTWLKWIMTPGSIQGWNAKQAADGGFIICGTTYDDSLNNYDAFLIKLDAIGTLEWTKIFATAWDDNASSLIQLADGGYIINGWTQSTTTGKSHMFLIRTDALGNSLWTKTIGSNQWDTGFSLFQSSDGGYVILGATNALGGYDGCIVKTDSSGNILWTKIYNDGDDAIFAGDQTSDGGYILAGTTAPSAMDDPNIYLLKTDSTGNLQWSKIFGSDDWEQGHGVKQTSDGGYIITGVYYPQWSFPYTDLLLIKTDGNGNRQWSNSYGGSLSDAGYVVKQTTDGGYLVAGASANFGSSNSKPYIIKTNSSGDEEWSKTILLYPSSFSSIDFTSDGGYLFAGSKLAAGVLGSPLLIAKTDSTVSIGCYENSAATTTSSVFCVDTLPATTVLSITLLTFPITFVETSGGTDSTFCLDLNTRELLKVNSTLLVSPNPVLKKLTIDNWKYSINRIEVYDILGEKMNVLPTFRDQLSIEIDVAALLPGLYFIRAITENGIAVGKFIKE